MTPERWQRIEELYHSADALPHDERARFLAAACGSDHELHREVASLLEERTNADGFLSQPAIVRGARMLSDVRLDAGSVMHAQNNAKGVPPM